jgi:hypothetical protein
LTQSSRSTISPVSESTYCCLRRFSRCSISLLLVAGNRATEQKTSDSLRKPLQFAHSGIAYPLKTLNRKMRPQHNSRQSSEPGEQNQSNSAEAGSAIEGFRRD